MAMVKNEQETRRLSSNFKLHNERLPESMYVGLNYEDQDYPAHQNMQAMHNKSNLLEVILKESPDESSENAELFKMMDHENIKMELSNKYDKQSDDDDLDSYNSNEQSVNSVQDRRNISDNEQSCSKRAEWTHKRTRLLLTLYKRYSIKVGKDKEFSSYGKLYEKLSTELSLQGITYTPAQVKQKWDSLIRSYKDMITKNNGNVAKRKECPYASELSEIFKRKRKVFPKILADADGESEVINSVFNSTNTSETFEEDELSNTPDRIPKRKPKINCVSPVSVYDKLLERLDFYHKQKLEQSERIAERKLAFMMRVEQEKREDRLALLEILRGRNLY